MVTAPPVTSTETECITVECSNPLELSLRVDSPREGEVACLEPLGRLPYQKGNHDSLYVPMVPLGEHPSLG